MIAKLKTKMRMKLVLLISLLAALFGAGTAARMGFAAVQQPAVGMVCDTGPSFSLTAMSGYLDTPDGNTVFMWGYARTGGAFQMPGPVLCVNQGDTVTVTLTNTLPEPVSIVFPGQSGVSATGGTAGLFTLEAPSGGTVTYSFVASEPGTYLYESGSNPSRQVQMGLYGALIVRPAGHPDWAYNDPATAFNPAEEYLLLLHDIDPALHNAVEWNTPYDVTTMHDRYWTINGRSMPDTLADNGVPWLPGQPYGALIRVKASANPGELPALIRYANAGMLNHPFHPHGNTLQIIGEDGRLLKGPAGEQTWLESFARTIGSGETYDLTFRWVDTDGWTSGGNPLPGDLPGLQNLAFKDNATFYSGSPYLGERGDLPTNTVSFNQCGEFYFPMHSHALNEFQNFDAGFGGMATVARVDPPGGCP